MSSITTFVDVNSVTLICTTTGLPTEMQVKEMISVLLAADHVYLCIILS